MVERTSYVNVGDGDFLSEGFFNETRGAIGHAGIFTEVNSRNRITHDMTTNEAVTSTNFSYDAAADNFYTTSGAAVLEMPTGYAFPNGTGAGNITGGYVRHGYYTATIYDECSDSSVDPALWDGSGYDTWTEDTDRMQMQTTTGDQTPTLENDRTTGQDVNGEFIIHGRASITTAGSNIGYFFRLNDGSVTANLASETSAGGADYAEANFTVVVSAAQNLAWFYTDKAIDPTLVSQPVDISSLTDGNVWSLQLVGHRQNTGTSTIELFFLRIIDDAETTTVTESFSSNNGSNFTTAGNGGYAEITSAQQGLAPRTRLTTTAQAGEIVVVDNVVYLSIMENEK